MVKIQKLPNGQLVITVPKRLAELKGWGKGSNLIFKDHSPDSFVLMLKKEDGKEEEKE